MERKENKTLTPQVDLISGGKGQGELASAFQSTGRLNAGAMRPFIEGDKTYITTYKGGDVNSNESYSTKPINVHGTLRRDEWKSLDEAIMEVSRQRLGGFDDLINAGLVYNLGNAMGTTVLEWHDVGEALEAVISMDGLTRGPNDRVKFQTNYLPIPIIHVDYEVNLRELEASRKLGNPLDTTMAERAARRVRETLEDMLFTDTSYSFGELDDRSRNTIYSYLNHPDISTVGLSQYGGSWDVGLSAVSGTAIVDSVLAMVEAAHDVYHYGPYQLYIPTNYGIYIEKDYDTTTPGTTIRERIMKIDAISGIKVVDRMPADTVILVQMTSDVVRVVRGMGLTNIEWEEQGRFLTKYKVLTIQVPQIRSDQNGRTGIVVMS